jgi:hypothetical protein
MALLNKFYGPIKYSENKTLVKTTTFTECKFIKSLEE